MVWRDGWQEDGILGPVDRIKSIAHGLVPLVSVASAIQSYFVIWQDLGSEWAVVEVTEQSSIACVEYAQSIPVGTILNLRDSVCT